MNIKDMNKCNAHKTKDPETCITEPQTLQCDTFPMTENLNKYELRLFQYKTMSISQHILFSMFTSFSLYFIYTKYKRTNSARIQHPQEICEEKVYFYHLCLSDM